VTFTLLGGTVFTYNVTASAVPGPHTFDGILKDENLIEYTVGGDTQVTVGVPGYAVKLWVDTGWLEVGPGVGAIYTLMVQNTGTTDDTYNLAAVTDADFAGFSVPTVAVLAGASALVELTVMDGQAGEYATTAEATSQGNPGVSDALIVTTDVTGVPPTYGVTVTAIPTERTVAPDADAVYTINIANTGTADDTYNLAITLNQADFANLSQLVVAVLAGNNVDVTLTVRDSTEGDYLTTVEATSQGDPLVSDDATVTTHVTTAPPVDTYFPTSVVVDRGGTPTGGVADLADGAYFVVPSAAGSTDWVIWYGVIEITDPGTVTGLTITYRGHNSSSVTQRLGIHNFAIPGFELVDVTSVGGTDTTIVWSTASPGDYISGGEVWVMVNSLDASAFTCFGDLMKVDVSR